MISVSSTKFCEQSIEETLKNVSKEFDHWEIFSEGEHYLPLVLSRFGAVAPSYNMKYSIHAPICDVNIAALSERMREASVMEMMSIMEQAISMEVKLITIHPGVHSMAVFGQEQKSVARAKKSLRTLDRVTSEYGIRIAVENMPAFPFFLARTAEELKDLLDGTDMKVCFDIGHAHTTGQIDPMIELLGDRIANIHIHDNHGQKDEHLTIGEGDIDFQNVLGKIGKYKGNYVIESKSLTSAVESKKKLQVMLGGTPL